MSWDYSAGPDVTYTPIEITPCSPTALGLNLPADDTAEPAEEEKELFWQARDLASRASLETYQGRLQCFDLEANSLKGNSAQQAGSQLVFLVEGCTSSCVENTRAQLKNKAIVLFANQRVFEQKKDADEPAIREVSKFHWIPLGPEWIEDNFFSLQLGEVEAWNGLLAPFNNDLERETENIFALRKGSTVGYKGRKEGVLAAVTIEMSLDLETIEWTSYSKSGFELAGIVGGLALFFWLLFFLLDHCCTIRSFRLYMASELYKAG